MTKPIEKMTVDELRWMRPAEIGNPPLVPAAAFDELARRNKLLVEALKRKIINRCTCVSILISSDIEAELERGPLCTDCQAKEALKQSEGEL